MFGMTGLAFHGCLKVFSFMSLLVNIMEVCLWFLLPRSTIDLNNTGGGWLEMTPAQSKIVV